MFIPSQGLRQIVALVVPMQLGGGALLPVLHLHFPQGVRPIVFYNGDAGQKVPIAVTAHLRQLLLGLLSFILQFRLFALQAV